MSISDSIMIIFGILIFALLITAHFKLVYRRFLKSYSFEIDKYLKEQGQNYETIYSPTKDDWICSPFKKPASFSFSFFSIGLLSWNDQKYKIIETDKGKTIWLEIATSYFQKPELTFKFGMKEKSTRKDCLQSKNIVVVTDNCPACGYPLKGDIYECPDCRLNFK